MKYTKVTSLSNPVIKEAIRIRKKPDRQRAFLIEGPHPVEMAAASPGVDIKRVFFTEDFASEREGQRLLKQAAKRTAHLIETSGQILSRLSDTETPQGIVAVVSYSLIRLNEICFKALPLLVVCDGVQDPGNLGTIIRASDASGADAVIMLPGTCDLFSPKAIRATAGSLFNIPVVCSEPDALTDYLESHKIKLYAADVHAQASLYESDLRQPVAIVFGNEAHGVSKPLLQKADSLLKIPIIGKAESLNVAMSASICLYEAVRQRGFSITISHFCRNWLYYLIPMKSK